MGYIIGVLVITSLATSFALRTPADDYFFFRFEDNTRIVGGSPAPVGSHPHMVALTGGFFIRTYTCGGSLLSQYTVLTAAHCIRDSRGGTTLDRNLRVTVGTNSWKYGGTQYCLSHGVIHPNYDHRNIKNDVGILITRSAVMLSTFVQPAVLSYEVIGSHLPVRVAGWGAQKAGDAASYNLQEVDLITIEGEECVDRVRQAAIESNTDIHSDPQLEICTSRGVELGTCNGDSGSALRRIDNGQQIGIVSWGFPCARGVPDMYTRISSFENFIRSNTVI